VCPLLSTLASDSATRMVDYDNNKVYTFTATKAPQTTASAACAAAQPVPGLVMSGRLWVVNGYSENQRVEWYFRQANAGFASYWWVPGLVPSLAWW
jgi:hypothetical protein